LSRQSEYHIWNASSYPFVMVYVATVAAETSLVRYHRIGVIALPLLLRGPAYQQFMRDPAAIRAQIQPRRPAAGEPRDVQACSERVSFCASLIVTPYRNGSPDGSTQRNFDDGRFDVTRFGCHPKHSVMIPVNSPGTRIEYRRTGRRKTAVTTTVHVRQLDPD
jgi:hypothetical protein